MTLKNILLAFMFILSFNFCSTTTATAAVLIPIKKDAIVLSPKDISKNDKLAQLKLYANMSVNDYAKMKGHKLNFFEKLSFKASQRQAKRMLRQYYGGDDLTLLEKVGNFCKGFLIGPIIIPLAYIFVKDDNKNEQIKWLWIGFGAAVLFIGIGLLLM